MPFYIPEEFDLFPHPKYVEEDIVAIGGNLNTQQIITAYSFGMFPWYNEEDPVLWWSPDPRCVLYPDNLKVSKSMLQLIRQNKFKLTLNTAFEKIITSCQMVRRREQDGTWIHPEIIESYIQLNKKGIAHSVEVWYENEIVGGLYGLALGKVFFGESMFSTMSNASKYGFIQLVRALKKIGFELIDCQQETAHLISLGAETIKKDAFHTKLSENRKFQLSHGHLIPTLY